MTAAPWKPQTISSSNIFANSGLAKCLGQILAVQQLSCSNTPFMADINIYWRLLKITYAESVLQINVWQLFSPNVLPIFGIWHAYKYSVMSVYDSFHPIITALEYPRMMADPVGTMVTNFPKLVVMERMFLGMYMTTRRSNTVGQLVRGVDYAGNGVPGANPVRPVGNKLNSLYVLLHEYTPLLIHMGILVRNCIYQGGEDGVQDGVVRCMQCALQILLALGSVGGRMQYIADLTVAMANWRSGHAAVHGAMFCEEQFEI